jgi:hypothetical protein
LARGIFGLHGVERLERFIRRSAACFDGEKIVFGG